MHSNSRAGAGSVAVSLVLGVSIPWLTGCGDLGADLGLEADLYDDAYEQAIIDVLDASEVVESHEVVVDGWVDTGYGTSEQAVIIEAAATVEEVADLLVSIAALNEYDKVPPLRLSGAEGDPTERWSVSVEDTVVADDMPPFIQTAMDTRWRLWYESPNHIWGAANYETLEEASGVLDVPEAAWFFERSDAFFLEVELSPQLSMNWSWHRTSPKEDWADAAEQVLNANLMLPGEDDRAVVTFRTSRRRSEFAYSALVMFISDELEDAPPRQRPAIAEQRGYRAYCETIFAIAEADAGEPLEKRECEADLTELIEAP